MGQCCSKEIGPKKQNKNIDDKLMCKVGVSVMEKDICVQIGLSRRAIKTYTDALKEEHTERDSRSSERRSETES